MAVVLATSAVGSSLFSTASSMFSEHWPLNCDDDLYLLRKSPSSEKSLSDDARFETTSSLMCVSWAVSCSWCDVR